MDNNNDNYYIPFGALPWHAHAHNYFVLTHNQIICLNKIFLFVFHNYKIKQMNARAEYTFPDHLSSNILHLDPPNLIYTHTHNNS